MASRPKKQQLIDDRQQSIAKENKKLMERMTKIMSETRSQPKHLKPESRSFSKVEVDRINFENKLLIHRLKTVPPVIDLDEMKQHFNRHCKIGSNLRRRQIKPLTSNKDGYVFFISIYFILSYHFIFILSYHFILLLLLLLSIYSFKSM